MNNESPQSDRATCDVLRRLFFSESKNNLLPVDLNLLAYLALRKAADHPIDDSEGTLAQRLCMERKAVRRSIDRLAETGWITVDSRGNGRSRRIALNVERFPAMQPVRERVSEAARGIVTDYMQALVRYEPKRKFPKGWRDRQAPSAQRLIDRCGGDARKAHDLLAVGFHDPALCKRVRKSLYHATLIFPQLEKAYDKRVEAMAAAQGMNEGTKNDESTTQRNEAA